MSRHHVRQHHWINGVLSTVEHFFDSLEDAIEHSGKSDAHTIKVYDDQGQLMHIVTPDGTETYA